jgi:hypothetical protein
MFTSDSIPVEMCARFRVRLELGMGGGKPASTGQPPFLHLAAVRPISRSRLSLLHRERGQIYRSRLENAQTGNVEGRCLIATIHTRAKRANNRNG